MILSYRDLVVKPRMFVIAAICAVAVMCATFAHANPITNPTEAEQNAATQVANMAADIARNLALEKNLLTPAGGVQAGVEAGCNLIGKTSIGKNLVNLTPTTIEMCELVASMGGAGLACPEAEDIITLSACMQSLAGLFKSGNSLICEHMGSLDPCGTKTAERQKEEQEKFSACYESYNDCLAGGSSVAICQQAYKQNCNEDVCANNSVAVGCPGGPATWADKKADDYNKTHDAGSQCLKANTPYQPQGTDRSDGSTLDKADNDTCTCSGNLPAVNKGQSPSAGCMPRCVNDNQGSSGILYNVMKGTGANSGEKQDCVCVDNTTVVHNGDQMPPDCLGDNQSTKPEADAITGLTKH